MSMINDALKRAREAQRKNIPTGVTPMRPIEARRKESDFKLFLPVLIILLVITAIFFIGLAMAKHKVKTIVTAPAIPPTQQMEAVAESAPNPPAATAPAPSPAAIGPAAINTNAPSQTLVQGIVNDPVRPWAIVNGKTVYVGSNVNGKRVTAISRNSITLVGSGQTNRLIIGQQ